MREKEREKLLTDDSALWTNVYPSLTSQLVPRSDTDTVNNEVTFEDLTIGELESREDRFPLYFLRK